MLILTANVGNKPHGLRPVHRVFGRYPRALLGGPVGAGSCDRAGQGRTSSRVLVGFPPRHRGRELPQADLPAPGLRADWLRAATLGRTRPPSSRRGYTRSFPRLLGPASSRARAAALRRGRSAPLQARSGLPHTARGDAGIQHPNVVLGAVVAVSDEQEPTTHRALSGRVASHGQKGD